MMTTLTVNIADKKTEKALTKAEQRVYNDLIESVNQIKLYKEGKLEFRDARALLNEL